MRPADQIKKTRSYVVHYKADKGYFVKPSHWQAGYTEAYKETPVEALDFAISQAEHEMMVAQAKVIELLDLRATVLAGVE